jgi:hypothetical protein
LAAQPLYGALRMEAQRAPALTQIPSVFVDAVVASPAFNKLAIVALVVWALGFSLVVVRLVAECTNLGNLFMC